jgi:hypothetical protein
LRIDEDPIVNTDGSFKKPKSIINALAVNIGRSVFDGNLSPSLYIAIVEITVEELKAQDFRALVLQSSTAV